MRLRQRVSGQVLVLVALVMVVVLAVAALAVDVGLAYGLKAKLNSAVDAAAIAALKARTSAAGTETMATQAALDFLDANFPYQALGVPQPSYDVRFTEDNGTFVAAVSASTVSPTFLAKVIGWKGLTVTAKSEATRSDLDLALVLDTTLSLRPVFGTVQQAATSFVSRFNPSYDRVALVPFATGVGLVDRGGELVLSDGVEINKTGRGFDKNEINRAISGLVADGSTDSELGMRIGLDQLQKVGTPASRRAIVFFSDGAPNVFTGNFPVTGSGTPVPGSLYSKIGSEGKHEAKERPDQLSRPNARIDKKPGKIHLSRLPRTGGGNFIGSVQILPEFSVDSKQRAISFDAKGDKDLKCSANMAARNVLEKVADYARSKGVVVFSLGYGDRLNTPEMAGSDCPALDKEAGTVIMKRIANTPDSDTYNPWQPAGIYCNAPTAEQLGPCFDAIANALLRLTK